MIAIKRGSANWRRTETPAVDEVQFSGEFLYEADGSTPAMVWDEVLSNVRPMTQTEKDARDAPAVQRQADRQDFRTQFDADITRLNAIISQDPVRDVLQTQAAITDLAKIVKRHLKIAV